MPTVKYMDVSYSCSKAIKGSDYVHLLDASGVMIAAFDGVSDLSKFSISNGNWTTPSSIIENKVAVIQDDGTTCTCNVPLKNFHRSDTATKLSANIHYGSSLPSSGSEGQLFFLVADA